MQTYATMKNSDVAWLGDIPADWQVLRGKFLYQNLKERNIGLIEPQRLALTLRGVIKRQDGDDVGLNPESLESYQIFEKDDLVFKLIDLENKQTSRVGLVPKRGIMSPAYIRLKPIEKLCAKYYYYFYYSLYLNYVYNNIAGEGVRANISAKELLEIQVPDLDYETQERIADYLDEETALIDGLIAKQQHLLELLEEKRRTTITRAVTRGLDPNAELKDTGIKWLSQVPKHWTIRKLGALTRLVVGSTPSTADSAAFDGDRIWVTIGDMNQKNISKSKQMLTEQAIKDKNMELIPKGSLLFSFKLSVGKVGYADVNLYTNEAIAAFLPNDLVKADFLYYAAQAYFINEANTNIYGAALFNQELLRRVRVAFPDVQEQGRIVEFLENEEAKIAATTKAILKQIDLLKERRTSLISSAVTGKIKV